MKELTISIIMGSIVIVLLIVLIEHIRDQCETKALLIHHYEQKIDSLDNEYYERFRWQHTRPMRVDSTLIEQDSILSEIYYYKYKIKSLMEVE